MEYLERLKKSIESLEDNSVKLSKVPELLTSVKGLTEEIIDEKKEIINSQKDLNIIKSNILNETKKVEKLTEDNIKYFDQTIATVKEEIIKGKKDNIEVVESISTRMNNKLDVSESNIQTTFNTKMSIIENEIKNSIIKNSKSIEEEIQNIQIKLDQYNQQINVIHNNIKQIQIIVIFTLITTILGLLISFIV